MERKYRRPMAKMMPHAPDTDHLAVIGTSGTATLAQQAARPVALQEVLARLAETHPAAAEAYAAAAAAREQKEAEEAAAALKVRPGGPNRCGLCVFSPTVMPKHPGLSPHRLGRALRVST